MFADTSGDSFAKVVVGGFVRIMGIYAGYAHIRHLCNRAAAPNSLLTPTTISTRDSVERRV